MNYGYARVSTKEQKEDRQIIALREAGVDESNIFVDKCSGGSFNRPQFLRLVPKLESGDVLFVKSIDRLGRSYEDIQTWWRRIIRFRQADIVVLDMPLLDTRSKGDYLTGKFIADLVLQILSYVAETERANIKKRQAEGIAAAKARGVRFGRAANPVPEDFEIICKRWKSKEISIRTACEILNMPPTTFQRKANAYFKEVIK